MDEYRPLTLRECERQGLFVHLLQQRQLPGVNELLQGQAVAEPNRKEQPGLRPGEDPLLCFVEVRRCCNLVLLV